MSRDPCLRHLIALRTLMAVGRGNLPVCASPCAGPESATGQRGLSEHWPRTLRLHGMLAQAAMYGAKNYLNLS
jgi:hypothetical protein